jgi:hypothetical protein
MPKRIERPIKRFAQQAGKVLFEEVHNTAIKTLTCICQNDYLLVYAAEGYSVKFTSRSKTFTLKRGSKLVFKVERSRGTKVIVLLTKEGEIYIKGSGPVSICDTHMNDFLYYCYGELNIDAYDSSYVYCYDDCRISTHGYVQAYLYGRATGLLFSQTVAYCYDKSSVRSIGASLVKLYDESRAILKEAARAEAYDRSTVYAVDRAIVWCNGINTVDATNLVTIWATPHSTVNVSGFVTVIVNKADRLRNNLSVFSNIEFPPFYESKITINKSNFFGNILDQTTQVTEIMVVYKKLRNCLLAVLEIEKGQHFQHENFNKCRTNKVKVLSIESFDGTKKHDKGTSIHDSGFIYIVGRTIECTNYNYNIEECSTGIHFFLTRQEAIDYRG